jgi:stage II sporulation protein AA (anti-sigma F factor antagonist)
MTVVKPQVNLDVAGSATLEKELAGLDGDVTIDLADVSFVASSGLRVMLKVAQRLKGGGGSLSVSNANDTVREVFRVSGFATVIDIKD